MRKTQVVSVLASVLLVVFIAGCGGGNKTKAPKLPKGIDWAPDFFLNPPTDDQNYYGVGTANLGNMNRNQQAAEHRARLALSRTLTSIIDGTITDYTEAAGTDASKNGVESFRDISQSLTTSAMSGSVVTKREVSPVDGSLWVQVRYPKDAAKTTAKSAIETAASRAANFKADTALKAMEDAFAKKRTQELVYE